MIDNYGYYKNAYRLKSDKLEITQSSGRKCTITSGETVTHFISGDPDITETLIFIGTDEDDSALFLVKGVPGEDEPHTVTVVSDIENIFPENEE